MTPAAPRAVLASGPLRPGGHAAGTLALRNQTGSRLAVGLRAVPDLDRARRPRPRAGHRPAGASSPTRPCRCCGRGTPGRLRLAPGAAARLRVVASLPADAETGYEGARVAVRLVPQYGEGAAMSAALHSPLAAPRPPRRALALPRRPLRGAARRAAPLAIGDHSFTLRSGSMTPALETGDVVVTEPVAPLAARVGQIVTFRDPEGSGKLFSHRVQSIRPDGEVVHFVTRGDANTSTERWSVPAGGTIGRVVYRVPKIGYALVWTATPAGPDRADRDPGAAAAVDGAGADLAAGRRGRGGGERDGGRP